MLVPDTAVLRRDPVLLSWPADPRLLPDLRLQVRSWLSELGFAQDTSDDIVLAASEAATNSIDHAYATARSTNTVELRLWVEDLAVRIEILDYGRWRTPRTGPTGRGLGMVMMRSLVDAVRIRRGPTGTTLVLRHRLPAVAPSTG